MKTSPSARTTSPGEVAHPGRRRTFCLHARLTIFAVVFAFLVLTKATAQQVDSGNVPESASLLSRYIQIPSVSGNERSAALFMDSVCRAKGLHVETLSDAADNYNFAASIFPLNEGRPNIIFLNHMDVVPAGPEAGWKYGAFSGAIAEGRIWGRGTVDMKGMAIMQLLAAVDLKNDKRDLYPYNVTVLFVSREETDNGGAKLVAEKFYEHLNPVVVFGEGGAGISEISTARPEQIYYTISVAEKRVLWLELKLKVPSSGHGSIPPLQYTNKALVKALNKLVTAGNEIDFNPLSVGMLRAIGKREKGLKRLVLSHPKIFKFILKPAIAKEPMLLATIGNTIAVTNIANPDLATNQIAQEARVLLDCRLMPGTDEEQFIESVRRKLGSNDFDIKVLFSNPNAPVSPESNFLKAFQNALEIVHPGSEQVHILFPAYTDNTYFRLRGVPVYGLNPVHLSQEQLDAVHNFNEHISTDQLEEGRAVYLTFLKRAFDQQGIVAVRK